MESRPSITQTLAERVVQADICSLPPLEVQTVRLHVADTVANALAASRLYPPQDALLQSIRSWSSVGGSRVWGIAPPLPPPWAALVNATLAHSLRMDDAHATALTNPGCTVVATVLAIAEAESLDGRDILSAVLAGYEVAVRVGKAINPSHRSRGFHGTGTVGTLAAAAAAARALGLDVVRTAWALGLAGTQAAGLQAFAGAASDSKALNAGKAAFNGVISAYWARAGIIGPADVLDAPEGFLAAFTAKAGEAALSIGRDEAGHDWKISEVSLKRHAGPRFADAALDAALALRGRHALDPTEIQVVAVEMSALAKRHTNRQNWTTIAEALASAPFGLAVALTRGGAGYQDYVQALNDASAQHLAAKVRIVVNHTEQAMAEAGLGARVTITTASGDAYAKYVPVPKGEPAHPLTDGEVQAKFRALSTMALSSAQSEALWSWIRELGSAAGPVDWTRVP